MGWDGMDNFDSYTSPSCAGEEIAELLPQEAEHYEEKEAQEGSLELQHVIFVITYKLQAELESMGNILCSVNLASAQL